MTASTKTIKLSATLRTIAGAKTVEVPVSTGATAGDLLRALAQVNPALGERVLDEQQQLSEGIQFLVSGRHIDFLQGLDTPIGESDNLMLIPPISGG